MCAHTPSKASSKLTDKRAQSMQTFHFLGLDLFESRHRISKPESRKKQMIKKIILTLLLETRTSTSSC